MTVNLLLDLRCINLLACQFEVLAQEFRVRLMTYEQIFAVVDFLLIQLEMK